MISESNSFRHQVQVAADRPEVHKAVGDLYADVAAQVARRQPLCSASGRCCRFEQYGHRLFVTTLEMAAFFHEIQALMDPQEQRRVLEQWDGRGCPFQTNRLCNVHPIRPFGCRMFFCDPTSTEWQNEQYERFHSQLKRLHEELQVPYAYVEWRAALRAIFG